MKKLLVAVLPANRPAALLSLDSAKALTPPLGFAEQTIQGVLPPGQLSPLFRQIRPKLGDALKVVFRP